MTTGTSMNDSMTDFSRLSFLIIEDYEGMRGILKDMLAKQGAQQVDFAATPQNAITALERKVYDAVLCDLHLGEDRNGQHLLEEARYRKLLGPATVWIMITAEKTAEMVMGTVEARPDDYLIKPITETTLQTRLARQLAKKHALVDIERSIRDQEYLKARQLIEDRLAQDRAYYWDLKRLLADLALRIGDYGEAEAIYSEALDQRNVPWARLGLGRLRFQEGDLEGANRILRPLADEHRIYMDAQDWLTRTLAGAGDHAGAREIASRAVALSPHVRERQCLLAETALRLGDLDTAEDAYRKALQLDRRSIEPHPAIPLQLARVYSEKGDAAQALQTLREMGQLQHEDPMARLLARTMEIPVHTHAGNQDVARSLSEKMSPEIRVHSNEFPPDNAIDLAGPLIQAGQQETAVDLLAGVVGNNHDQADYLQRVQEVFSAAGMDEEGRRLIQDTCRSAIEIMDKGVILSRSGKWEEAMAWMREAKSRLPNNPRLLLNHAYLLIAYMEQFGRDYSLEQEARQCIDSAQRLKPQEKRIGELLTKLEMVGNDLDFG